MAIGGILFDKDGTLLDFNATWVPINRAAARLVAGGDDNLAADLLRAGGQDDKACKVAPGSLLAASNTQEIAACWAELAPNHGIDDLVGVMDALFQREGARHAVAVDGLEPTIKRLNQRGLKLGIATSDSREGALATLSPFGILEYFDFIAGYDSGFGTKPGPGMVLGFAEATNLKPDEILVIGDNHHDLEMGRNAGAGMLVGVLTGTSGREHLSDLADHIVDSITELEHLL
ncbi:MAG: HAD family hydrolase [Rhodospirillaceae bacterium]|jgi:phosphoglycolate phosphatase|nr:HAD family hydrolase [Rhodospirillaceae bacterium]